MGRSTAFYKKSAKGRKVKAEYQKKFNAQEEQLAKRRELGKRRYKDKKKGKKIDGLDYDHATQTYEKPSVNRGRKEKSRLKGSKRKK